MLSDPTARESEEESRIDETVTERITLFMRRKEARLQAAVPPEQSSPPHNDRSTPDPDPYIT